MSRLAAKAKVLARLLFCGVLLAWIFHSIFLREARSLVEDRGEVWTHLSTSEQWQVAWTHGPAALWSTLTQVHPGAFILSIILVGITLMVGAIRWRMALVVQGLPLSWWRTTEISFVAAFFNSFLLGSTGGDLLKAYYAARETHHKKAEAVTTVFVDRLVGLFTMLLFACVMMPLNLGLLLEHKKLAAVSGLVVAMFFACCVIVVIAFSKVLDGRFPKVQSWLHRLPKLNSIERSLAACRLYGAARRFQINAVVLSTLVNVLCVLQAIVLCRGLNLEVSSLALFVIIPIITCISALPITPSGLGVRETLFVTMLTAPEINADKTRALSLSLLIFAGTLFWSLIGGIVYACLRQSQHLDEIQEPEDAKPV